MNMNSASSQIVAFLLDWALRGAVLALAAGLIVTVARLRDIRTRLALWSALLLGSLTLPAVRPFMPSLLPRLPSPEVRQVMRPVRMLRVHAPVVALTQSVAMPTVGRRSYLPEIGLGLWAAGALLLLARLLTGLVLARWVIRGATPIEDRTRHMRGLRVLESGRVNVPLSAGVFRPVVLLPEDWREWDSERLRAVLAHERSHVERRDGLVRVVAQLHRAVLWFSPVAWWLQRHLNELAECASDDFALSETMDREAYAAVVLEFFRARGNRPTIEGLAMAQGGSAERRIDRILAGGPLCGRLRRSTLIMVLALTTGSVALVAGLQNGPRAPEPPAVPMAPVPPVPRLSAVPPVPAAPDPPSFEENDANGDGWVMFHGKTQTMSGGVDLREGQAIFDRARQDMIWLRRGDKTWVINDADFLRRASELFRPVEDLSSRQESLGQQEEILNRQQEALSATLETMRGRMPNVEDELKKVEEQLRIHEPTAEQLSDVQEKLANMQEELARAQEGMNQGQEELDRKIEELGRKQDDLGRIQESLGDDQEKAGTRAEEMLQKLLDEAIRTGVAKPGAPAH